MMDKDCCGGAGSCRAGSDGALRCLPAAAGAQCTPSGYSCRVPEQCCGGRCAPDATGALACRATCVPPGAPCAGPGDCCSGLCSGAFGGFVCLPVPDGSPGASVCAPLGEPCDPLEPACCADGVCVTLATGGSACASLAAP
jgi:hypothetical protein